MMGAAAAKNPLELVLGQDRETGAVSNVLRSIRTHLGMQVAYVSEFVGNRTVFRDVDAPGLEHLIKVGDSQSLDDVYCRHILEGRLPSLMPDTSAEPFAAAMAITNAVPIGKHMSIPIRLADGEVYGMFCCLGPAADASLNERDLQTMKVFAEFTAQEVQREVTHKRAAEAKLNRITSAMTDGRMSIAYQPIFDLRTEAIVGFECLARFASTPYRTPDVWFKEAIEVDHGPILEMAAIKLALRALEWLPSHMYLGLNASPNTVLERDFITILDGAAAERVVLEVTEHAEVQDYAALRRALAPLRQRGVRLAVDDAGAGYSGLQHILALQPDLIKLDLALTRNIDEDVARRALAAALVNFADATDSAIIAEGVEKESELMTLKQLGVQKAQGYLLGRPTPLSEALCAIEYGRPHPVRAATASPRDHTSASAGCTICADAYGRP